MKLARTTAVIAAALSATLTALIPSWQATAAPASPDHIVASSHYLKIAGAGGQGLRLRSEHLNRDGSVASSWTDGHGNGFTYAGSPNATVHMRGQKGHITAAAVSFPQVAKNKRAIAQAIATYSKQSIYSDAVNAGVPQKTAATVLAKFAKHQGRLTPYILNGVNSYQGGCIYANPAYYTAGVSGCVQRALLQANGADWWVSDDMIATENTLGLWTPSNLLLEMWYGAGNSLVSYTAAPGGTNCHQETVSGGLGYNGTGVGWSETNNVCGGSTNVVVQSGLYGVHWGGALSNGSQETIEGIDVVHSPPSASIGQSDLELQWGPQTEEFVNCTPPFSNCPAHH